MTQTLDIVRDGEGLIKKKSSRIVSRLLDGATTWRMDQGNRLRSTRGGDMISSIHNVLKWRCWRNVQVLVLQEALLFGSKE